MEFASLKRLADAGTTFASKTGLWYDDFVIVSIPLSKRKEKDRGFNQVDHISKLLSEKMYLKIQNSILTRVKDTSSQHGFGRKKRSENMKDAFKVNKKLVKDKKIVLVDDICTTGATFLSATKALYEVGAKEVRCFSLSRVI